MTSGALEDVIRGSGPWATETVRVGPIWLQESLKAENLYLLCSERLEGKRRVKEIQRCWLWSSEEEAREGRQPLEAEKARKGVPLEPPGGTQPQGLPDRSSVWPTPDLQPKDPEDNQSVLFQAATLAVTCYSNGEWERKEETGMRMEREASLCWMYQSLLLQFWLCNYANVLQN